MQVPQTVDEGSPKDVWETSSKVDACEWLACHLRDASANKGAWRDEGRGADISCIASVPATQVCVHVLVVADVLQGVGKACASVATVLAVSPWKCDHSDCTRQWNDGAAAGAEPANGHQYAGCAVA